MNKVIKNFQFLNISKSIVDKIEKLVTNYDFDNKPKNIIFMSLFEISRQHAKSILFLCEKKFYNSAASLVRPLVEAHYRGLYIIYFLSNEKCMEALNFPSLSKIADKLNKKYKIDLFSKDIDIMHDLTHNGMHQINRMLDGNYIKTSYSKQDLVFIFEITIKNILLFLINIGIYFDDDVLQKEAEIMLRDFNKKLDLGIKMIE